MIKTEKQTIKNIGEYKASRLKAYNLADSKYNTDKKELEIMVNVATGKMFRLVHDGKTAFTIIEGTDKNQTACTHNIEEFETVQECLDQIKELGLQYNPQEETETIIKQLETR